MKVAVVTSSGGRAAPQVMAAYAQALLGLGHEVEVVNVDLLLAGLSKPSAQKIYQCVTRTLKAFAPEFALFYAVPQGNGLFNEQGAFVCETLEIPFVSLFCDDPFVYLQQLAPESRQQLIRSDLYQVFCSDKYYTQELRRFGFEHAEYLALATDPSIFNVHQNKPVPKRFECDVCFAGSIDSSPELLTLRRKQRWERFPILNAAIDKIMIEAKKPAPETVIEKLQQESGNLPWDIYAVFCRTVYEEASTYMRRATINAINKHPVKVFGPDKWAGMNPNISHGGKIDYTKGLALLYASSQIVLNITSPQLRDAATSRLFDVPASGGFVLSDYRPVMAELFGDAVDTYADTHELRAKIDHYLAHPKERKERSLRMREIVLQKHTWEHRAKDLLRCMAGRHAFS